MEGCRSCSNNQKEPVMETKVTHIDVKKLRLRLQIVRAKSLVAIILGDCHAVARLTCQAARLRDAIQLSGALSELPVFV